MPDSPYSAMRFGPDYREVLTLRDGRHVLLRTVRPSDKERLQEGLALLSTDAVVARFLAVKRRLSREELVYLTEFDGVDHYALGALLLKDDGSEGQGLGVARLIRFPDDPMTAEPAVVVLDQWQGQGLGRILFDRLTAAACERGIRRFHVEFLPNNEGIQRLLEGIAPGLLIWRQGEVVVTNVPLPGVAEEDPGAKNATGVFATLLRLAAERLIRLATGAVPKTARATEPDGGAGK
jgi:GNAT superfamily N-acetyltransferase